VVQTRHVTGLAAKFRPTKPCRRSALRYARACVCVAHLVVGHNEYAMADLRVKSQVGSGTQKDKTARLQLPWQTDLGS
jgi:hypothetical protein